MSFRDRKTRNTAFRQIRLNRYRRLQKLLVILITEPELLHGRNSHELIRDELRQKGTDCCCKTISTYFRLLRITRRQKEITDRNIKALHRMKP